MANQLKSIELQTMPVKALTRAEIKKEMKRRRGFTMVSYSRLVKRSPGAITRLVDGKIGGDLRERFLKFFSFTEEEVPYRGWR